MSNITPINNVLMQPIQWNGQVYFTSHYFHQQYQENSKDGGKYAELKNFNKLVRGIEAYKEYADKADIVELNKSETGSDLEPVFKATRGNPIMLINATAQVALTHHLDDEVSKSVSVAVNEQTAKQLPTTATVAAIARETRGRLQLAKMFGLAGSKAQIAVNEWVHRDHGINVMDELGVKFLKSEHQSPELTGTEIGERALFPGNGSGKAQNVNLALWKMGFLRSIKGEKSSSWEVTEKGLSSGHIEYDDMAKENGKRSSMQVIVYRESLIDELKKAEAMKFDFKSLKLERKEKAA